MVGVTEEDLKKALKEILNQLHAGVPPEQVKERFRQFLEGVSSLEIAKIEQELISEGISREEIQRLYDVHLAIFREQLEKQRVEALPTSPIGILLEEHKVLQQITQKLGVLTERVQFQDFKRQLGELANAIKSSLDSHVFKEKNILFPTAQRVVKEQEWAEVRADFEIGYYCFTPDNLTKPARKPSSRG